MSSTDTGRLARPAGAAQTALLLFLSAAFALGGAALLWQGSNEASGATRHRNDRAELELVALRAEMTRAQLDELTLRLLEPFGLATTADIEAAAQSRVEALDSGRRSLSELSTRPGPAGNQARQILGALDQFGPQRSDASLYDLLDGSGAVQFEAAPPPRSPVRPIDSLRELVWLDQSVTFTLHEALVASYHQSPQPTSFDGVEYFEEFAGFVADEGGYLGPDPSTPLTDGYIGVDRALVHEGSAVTLIDEVVAATGLWKSDQWVRSWGDGDLATSPIDLQVLAMEAGQATSDIRNLADERLSAETETRVKDVETASMWARLAWIAGVSLLALSFAGFVLVVFSLWRRTRHLHHQLSIDPLTRIGNRNHLQTETTRLLLDPRLTHHALVMIDMDHFKITNDTYGHSIGDQLLQRLANGLTGIAESTLSESATIVRLGGDEFALTLHGAQPIDIDRLRDRLNLLRSQHIAVATDQTIVLAFSYGIAAGAGTPDLQQLLDSADLAAYQQKAERLAERQAQPGNQPAPASFVPGK